MILLTDEFIREHPVLLYGIFSSQDMANKIHYRSVNRVIDLLRLNITGKKAAKIGAIPRGLKQRFHWEAAQMNDFVQSYNPSAKVNLNGTVFFTKENARAIVEWVGSIYEP